MKKYKVKLDDERVVGPLNNSDIKSLIEEGKLLDQTPMQLLPSEEWLTYEDFKEDILRLDATFIKKLDSLLKPEAKPEVTQEEVEPGPKIEDFPKEFKFEKIPEPLAPIEDETLILNQKDLEPLSKSSEEDKTKITPETKNYLAQLKKEKERKEKIVTPIQEEKEEVVIDLKNDSTQFFDIAEVRSTMRTSVSEAEEELEIEKEEVSSLKKEEALAQSESAEAEPPKKVNKKKKSSLLLILLVLGISYFLLDEDETEVKELKKIEILSPSIKFPRQYEIIDELKATQFYKKGLNFLESNSYVSRVNAAKAFRISTEHKFKENPAMAKLIFLYSSLLENSNEPEVDRTKIFKLIQIFKSKALLDVHFSSAIALFYLNTRKYAAAENTIDKFLALEQNKPTLELFGIYLAALQGRGELEKANKVLKKLSTVAKRPLAVDMRILSYLDYLGKKQEYSSLLDKLLGNNLSNISLLLLKAREKIEEQNSEVLVGILTKVRKLEAGRSKVYYSKYLEYKGLLTILEGDYSKANGYFKRALQFNESSELRSHLSKLEFSEDEEANQMISESKALKLIKRSEEHFSKENKKEAFKDALEAVSISSDFIPASLNLAKLQINYGLYKEAIDILENLQKRKITDPEITFLLIDAYTQSYKFNEVKKLLSIISSSSLVENYKYYKATAKYYVYKKDFINSVNWLQLAIKKNPLDEETLVEMAKILIEYRKFNKAKVFMSKLIDLDPINLAYRVMYADILYESESSSSAIGYVYDILKFYPKEPKLLSAIGIYYYRSGQQKKYQNIKKELEGIPNKEYSLYQFLVKSALLDNDIPKIIQNAIEILNIRPGDLKIRMLLGKTYMESEKYEKALEQFKKVELRLESYPRLQYFMSKLYLLTDNVKKAITLAQKEIKSNPQNIDGYVLLGDIYRKEKKYNDAEDMYKKAQKINSKDIDTLLGLSSINLKKSQFDIAIDLLKKARELDPNNSATHKLLGDAYRKIGQSSLAIESYKIFLELSGSSRYKDEINSYIKLMQ